MDGIFGGPTAASAPPLVGPEFRAAGDPPAIEVPGYPPAWEEQGPATILDGGSVGSLRQPVSGAIQTIAIHPTRPDVAFIGSVNGGIWRTTSLTWSDHDGVDNNLDDRIDDPLERVTWTRVNGSDDLPSLSISSIEFDPTNPDVIYAAIGASSSYRTLGGAVSGLYRSGNGGETWDFVKVPEWATSTVAKILPTSLDHAGQRIVLAAVRDPGDPTTSNAGAGLWISADNGETFSRDFSLLGGATDVVADPRDPTVFYAAIAGYGVYRGVSSAGPTGPQIAWTAQTGGMVAAGSPVPGTNSIGRVLLDAVQDTTGATVVYAAVAGQGSLAPGKSSLLGAFRAIVPAAMSPTTATLNWTSLGGPTTALAASNGVDDDHDGSYDGMDPDEAAAYGLHPGGQANLHMSLAVDPDSADVFYLGGDTQPGLGPEYTIPIGPTHSGSLSGARLFQGEVSHSAATASWASLVVGSLVSNAPIDPADPTNVYLPSPHPDSRKMLIREWTAGTKHFKMLLEADDGGVFGLVGEIVVNDAGTPVWRPRWESLNGNLAITELTRLAWDPVANVLIAGAQDNGILYQNKSGIDNDGNGRVDAFDDPRFWSTRVGGDGVAVSSVAASSGASVRYLLTNSLFSFFRDSFDSQNQLLSSLHLTLVAPGQDPSDPATLLSGLLPTERSGFANMAGSTLDPDLFLVSTVQTGPASSRHIGLYETWFPPEGNLSPEQALQFVQPVPTGDFPGSASGDPRSFSALVYGGRAADGQARPGMFYAAGDNRRIYVREDRSFGPSSANPSRVPAARYQIAQSDQLSGARIWDISVDPGNWRHGFAVTDTTVYEIHVVRDTNGIERVTTKDVTGSLAGRGANFYSVEFVPSGTVPGVGGHPTVLTESILLVGSSNGIYRAILPRAEAAVLSFTEFAPSLPNAIVTDIVYNRDDDVLAVATLGRGAFLLRDVSAQLTYQSPLIIHGDRRPDRRDILYLRTNGSNPDLLDVFLNNSSAVPNVKVPIRAISEIEFDGGEGDDVLTLAVTNGVPGDHLLVRYFGGGGGADELHLENNSTPQASVTVSDSAIAIAKGAGFMRIETAEVEEMPEPGPLGPDPTRNEFDQMIAGLLHLSWGSSGLSSTALPGTGSSWFPAFGTGPRAEGNPVSGPTSGPEEEGSAFALGQAGQTLLERIFRENDHGFTLQSLAAQAATLTALQTALEELDDVHNVYQAGTPEAPQLDVEINTELDGDGDLSVSLLDGLLTLGGRQRFAANVRLHLRLGVDTHGFYIEPGPDAELTFSGLHTIPPAEAAPAGDDESEAAGTGRIGFLEIQFDQGHLEFDPRVQVRIDLRAPPGVTDGRIRIEHVVDGLAGLAETSVVGAPGDQDVHLVATIRVSAFLPGEDDPLGLGEARLRITWPDANHPETGTVQPEIASAAAEDLIRFLNATGPDILEGLGELATLLDTAAGTDVLGARIPLLNRSLGDLLDLDPMPKAYDAAEIQTVSSLETIDGHPVFSLTFREHPGVVDGIQAGDRVEYKTESDATAPGHVAEVHFGFVLVQPDETPAQAPNRSDPAVRVHQRAGLGDQLRAALSDLFQLPNFSLQELTLQNLMGKLSHALGVSIDAGVPTPADVLHAASDAPLSVHLTGTGDSRAFELLIPIDPAALDFSVGDSFNLDEALPELRLSATGNFHLTVDPSFQIGLGVRLGSGLSLAQRIYLIDDTAGASTTSGAGTHIALGVNLQLDDPVLDVTLGFAQGTLHENGSPHGDGMPNQGILISGTLTLGLKDAEPGATDDARRVTLQELTHLSLGQLVSTSLTLQFDIDGLALDGGLEGGPAFGTCTLSLDGEREGDPGYITEVSQLGRVVEGIQVDCTGAWETLSLGNPLEILQFIRSFVTWLDHFQGSGFFRTQIPLTHGTTIGDVADFSSAFVTRVYRAVTINEVVAGGRASSEVLERGVLSGPATLTIQLDEDRPATVTVVPQPANTSLSALVENLNAAILAGGLGDRITAVADANRRIHLQTLPGVNVGVIHLVVDDATDPAITEMGFNADQTGLDQPAYDNLQALGKKLSLGLDPSGSTHVEPAFNGRELTFRLVFQTQDDLGADFAVGTALADLGPLTGWAGSGSLTVAGRKLAGLPDWLGALPEEAFGLHLGLTLGIDFLPVKEPELVTSYSVPPPSDGRITHESHFTLQFGAGRIARLILPVTTTNHSLANLVTQLNNLFAANTVNGISLDKLVRAEQRGNAMVLIGLTEDTNHNGQLDPGEDTYHPGALDAVNFLRLTADEEDPIVAEVGFRPQQTARASIKGLFLDQASFKAGFSMEGNVTGSAQFEIFGATLSGEVKGGATVVAELKRPGTGASAKFYLSELMEAIRSGDFDTFFPDLRFDGAVSVVLSGRLQPVDLFGGELSALQVWIPHLKDPTGRGRSLAYNPNPYAEPDNTFGVFVTLPDFGDFFSFQCLDWLKLIAALDDVVNTLQGLRGFDFLSKPLPFINRSLGDAFNFAANLAGYVQRLHTATPASLESLQTDLRRALGIDASQLTLSLESADDPVLGGGSGTTPAFALFRPAGANNDLRFQSTETGSNGDGVRIHFVDNGSVSGPDYLSIGTLQTDASGHRVVTVQFASGKTRVRTLLEQLAPRTDLPLTVTLQPESGGGTSANDGSGVLNQKAIKFRFHFGTGLEDAFPFALNLEDLVAALGPGSGLSALVGMISSAVDVGTAGEISLSARADAVVEFGFDLSNPCQIVPFLSDATSIAVTARVLGTDLEFTAALGGVTGLFIRGGQVTLDADGDPATPAPAQLRLGFAPDPDGDGRRYFGTGYTSASLGFRLTAEAGITARIPMFFPTSFTPLGGGGDNVLELNIPNLRRVFLPDQAEGSVARVEFAGLNNDLEIHGGPSIPEEFKVRFIQDATVTSTSGPHAEFNDSAKTLEIRFNDGQTTAAEAIRAIRGDARFAASRLTADDDGSESTTGNSGAGALVQFHLKVPDFTPVLVGFNPCDLIENLPMLLDGLDQILGGIQSALDGKVFNVRLPVVGDKLGNAARFIQEFRAGLLGRIRSKLHEVGTPLDLLKEAIWEVLGAPGLNLLKRVDAQGQLVDESDHPVPDDDHAVAISDFHDIIVNCAGDHIDFKLRLIRSLDVVNTEASPIQFDVGNDLLGLEVDGNVQVRLKFDLKLYFGISTRDGFYFDTSAGSAAVLADPAASADLKLPELQVQIDARIPDVTLRGHLFFLQLDATDHRDPPTHLTVTFDVNLNDPHGSGERLTVADLGREGVDLADALEAKLRGEALVNLDLTVSFGGDARFPRLRTQFYLSAGLTGGTSTDFGAALTAEFRSIQLDVGQFASEVLRPILQAVRQATEPLAPIVRILKQRLPVLSELAGHDYSLIDLATDMGLLSQASRDFIDQLATIIELANDTSIERDGSLPIGLGDIVLIRTATGGYTSSSATDEGPGTGISDRLPGAGAGAGAGAAFHAAGLIDDVKNFFMKLERNLGIKFPILKPSEIFKLLRGQAASIVEYHMPTFEFDLPLLKSFPLFPPLFVKLGGQIQARIDLTFGYDTYGIQRLARGDTDDASTLFDGFYIRDVNDAGEDVPELSLLAKVVAAAELNLGIISGGAGGAIQASILFNLNDPDADGRVRFSEMVANIRTDIRCLFDIDGKMTADLVAFLKIDLGFWSLDKEFNLASVTLFAFTSECPKPLLASFDHADAEHPFDAPTGSAGTLTLHLGPRAGLRGDADVYDTNDDAETFVIEHASGDALSGETVKIKWNGITQEFRGVRRIIGDGGNFDDVIDARGVTVPVEFEGGDGEDTLYAGDGGSQLRGGPGGDHLWGGVGMDVLAGNDGNDELNGRGGIDILDGGPGNDALDGGDAGDTLTGGPGEDQLKGQEGDDHLAGDDGNDLLEGGIGADDLIGGAGNDILDGGGGDDLLIGDEGHRDDSRPADPARVDIVGLSGDGNDILEGGGGADVIFGCGGNDTIFGGTRLARGESRSLEVDGSDFIDAGSGDDRVVADDGQAGETAQEAGAVLGDRVWLDANGNGIQEESEAGVAGIVVHLLDEATGRELRTAPTGTDGTYRFSGLRAGLYSLSFTLPSGWTFTPTGAGSDRGADNDVNAGADPTSGRTAAITLGPAEQNLDWDAGVIAPLPSLSVDDVAVVEGNGDLTRATLTVTLSFPAAERITVCYLTREGTASAGNDFTPVTGTLVFEPGVTEASVSVPIAGDAVDEDDEQFTLLLCDPTNATLSDSHGAITILDDEEAPRITIQNGHVPAVPERTGLLTRAEIFAEEAGELDFTVSLSHPSARAITVQYRTSMITDEAGLLATDAARAGILGMPRVDYEDTYETVPGEIHFAPGETEATLFIRVADDPLNELDERFQVELQLPSSVPPTTAVLGRMVAEGTILGSALMSSGVVEQDDPLPSVSFVANATPVDAVLTQRIDEVVEGHVGWQLIHLPVQLSAASGRLVQVDFTSNHGTATESPSEVPAADYEALLGSVTFAPGETAGEILVKVFGDTDYEPDVTPRDELHGEYFFVKLLGARGATLVPSAAGAPASGAPPTYARVDIQDDDLPDGRDWGPWSVQFASRDYVVRESDGFADIEILRTAGSTNPYAVFWTQAETARASGATADYDGFYEGSPDYPRGRATVQFPGDTEHLILHVPIHDNTRSDGSRTVQLFLRNPAGGPVHGAIRTATLTILDDEPLPTISIDDASVSEGDGVATLSIHLSAEAPRDLNVRLQTLDRTAVHGTDFGFMDVSVPIARGEIFVTWNIPIVDDPLLPGDPSLPEDPEFFLVRLSLSAEDARYVALADAEATVRILDNDPFHLEGDVFLDVNGNGVYEPGTEQLLPGVRVGVTQDGSRVPLLPTPPASHSYGFEALTGDVRIEVDESTLPIPGLVLTTGNSPQTVHLHPTGTRIPAIGYALPAATPHLEDLRVSGDGGAGGDTAYGGAGDDWIAGGGGDDRLIGGHWLGPACSCDPGPYDVHLVLRSGHLELESVPAPSSIRGLVWLDANLNSVRDDAEQPLAGVRVNLWDENFLLVATTLTQADGSYAFADLVSFAASCRYSVQFLPDTGRVLVSPNIGDDTSDSDPDPASGLVSTDSLAPGTDVTHVDAGLRDLPPPGQGPWSVQFTSPIFTAREEDGFAVITVWATPDTIEPVAVLYSRDGGFQPASKGVDYLPIHSDLRFGPGERLLSIRIPILRDDSSEGVETVELVLKNPPGGPIHGNLGLATLLIFDSLCTDDDTLLGGDGGDFLLGDFGYVSEGSPHLQGGVGHDDLAGGAGEDSLFAQGGNDRLRGGAADDEVDGGAGDDSYLFVGDDREGSDTLHELPGALGGEDTIDLSLTTHHAVTLDLSLTGSAQTVTHDSAGAPLLALTLPGGTERIENIRGGAGADVLRGDELDNRIEGGEGDDLLVGGPGTDILAGGLGDDTYLFNADVASGHDVLVEATGEGIDWLDFSPTVRASVTIDLSLEFSQTVNENLSVRLSTPEGFENVRGGGGNDQLDGNLRDNVIQGGPGEDTLNGGGGNDTALEQRGGDFELADGDAGTVRLVFNTVETDILSGFQNITLVGDNHPNLLDAHAFSGRVVLDGRGGNDHLVGGSGENVLTGGPGEDLIDGTLGHATLREESDANFVLSADRLRIGSEIDTLLDIEEAWLIGGPGDNILDARFFSGPVTLEGRSGTDHLFGGPKADRLIGGPGDDELVGGAGNDIYVFDADLDFGTDTVAEAAEGGIDLLDFSPTTTADLQVDLSISETQLVARNVHLMLMSPGAIENVTGGAQADRLIGNDQNNVIDGGAGFDTLTGGAGNDALNGGEDGAALVEQGNLDFTLTDVSLAAGGDLDALENITRAELTGGDGDNHIIATGFHGPVLLRGGEGMDHLVGGAADDILIGEGGDDDLSGGAGNDRYVFDADQALGSDVVREGAADGVDTLDFSATESSGISIHLGASGAQTVHPNLTLTLANPDTLENVVGTSGDDVLEGNSANNRLEGGLGSDRYVFNGNNTLGSDQIVEALADPNARDTLDFSATTLFPVQLDLAQGSPQLAITDTGVTPVAHLVLSLGACNVIENIVGGAQNDTFTVTPSDQTILNVDGGGGLGDQVICQTLGLTGAQDGSELHVDGRMPIRLIGIEDVTFVDESPVGWGGDGGGDSEGALLAIAPADDLLSDLLWSPADALPSALNLPSV